MAPAQAPMEYGPQTYYDHLRGIVDVGSKISVIGLTWDEIFTALHPVYTKPLRYQPDNGDMYSRVKVERSELYKNFTPEMQSVFDTLLRKYLLDKIPSVRMSRVTHMMRNVNYMVQLYEHIFKREYIICKMEPCENRIQIYSVTANSYVFKFCQVKFLLIARNTPLPMSKRLFERLDVMDCVKDMPDFKYYAELDSTRMTTIEANNSLSLEVYKDFTINADVPEEKLSTLPDSYPLSDFQKDVARFWAYHKERNLYSDLWIEICQYGRYTLYADFVNSRQVILSLNRPDTHHRPSVFFVCGTTGVGKTRATLNLVEPGDAVVVPTPFLVGQWKARAKDHGKTWLRVGLYRSMTAKNPVMPDKGCTLFVDEGHLLKAASNRRAVRDHVDAGGRVVFVTATPGDIMNYATGLGHCQKWTMYSHLMVYGSYELQAGKETEVVRCPMTDVETKFFNVIYEQVMPELMRRKNVGRRIAELFTLFEQVSAGGVFDADFQIERVKKRLLQPTKKAEKRAVEGVNHQERVLHTDSKNDSCPICFEDPLNGLTDVVDISQTIECSHRFCTECITAWTKRPGQRNCPLCRESFTILPWRPLPRKDKKEADKKRKSSSKGGDKKRQKTLSGRASVDESEARVTFTGKRDKFVQMYRAWREKYPKDSLVIGVDTKANLDWYLRTTGGFVLESYDDQQRLEQPGSTAIVEIRKCDGKDLYNANHVWIMDLSRRAYKLVQMVGRVTRLSQQKRVYVKYFVYPFGEFLVRFNETGNLNPTKNTMILFMYHLSIGKFKLYKNILEELIGDVWRLVITSSQAQTLLFNDGELEFNMRTRMVVVPGTIFSFCLDDHPSFLDTTLNRARRPKPVFDNFLEDFRLALTWKRDMAKSKKKQK